MGTTESPNASCTPYDENSTDGESSLWPLEVRNAITIILVGLYLVAIVLGVFWNLVVIRAFKANRLPRNIILLHVCIADLLVCVLSCPSSIIIIAQPKWRAGWIMCKVVYFLQSVPMVTSTMLLMMLSIDRYLTIRRPRLFPAMNREERKLNKVMAICSWVIAITVCSPIMLVRDVVYDVCIEVWSDPQLKTVYVVCYIMFLYVLPMGVVARCHFSVGTGIFSTSLFEAMANGDVPLPMPIQAPNQQVIILASVNEMNPMFAKNERKLSTNQELAEDTRNRILQQAPGPSSTRRGFRDRFKLLRGVGNKTFHQHIPPPRPPSSQPLNTSFKIRRKMAKMLIIMAIVFALAWFPYVVTRLYMEFAPNPNRPYINQFLPFFLFIGHFHSVINPFVYWCLNRQSIPLKISFQSLLPWNWGNHRRNIFRRIAHYFAGEDDDHYSRSSSTNEAQLGVFHPRFTRPRRYEAEDQV